MRAAVVAAALCPAPALSQAADRGALRIDGSFAQPRLLSVADVERCVPREVEIRAPAPDGSPPRAPRRYTGCRLRDLVGAAQPVERQPRELRRSYLVATAVDGYQVVFSWAELMSTAVGDEVIVAYGRDGAPLREDEGPLSIVSGADRGASRHVKDVRAIELRPAGR
jgi:DMSO/TMAO reductase YedYZ molybdopterin-dependent catalytic subunit